MITISIINDNEESALKFAEAARKRIGRDDVKLSIGSGDADMAFVLNSEAEFASELERIFKAVQDRLNLLSAPDELWDVLDGDRRPTGRLHKRGIPLPYGEYHMSVHVWVQRPDGRFLLTKRTPNKGYANMWECSGGSSQAGDTSLEAALREVREETGIILKPENGRLLWSTRYTDTFMDVWLFRQDFRTEDVVFLENETCGARAELPEGILQLRDSGELVPFEYLDRLFEEAEK